MGNDAMMEAEPVIKPDYYFQPVLDPGFSRIMKNNEEYVSYLKNSSFRIWMNKEKHGYEPHWHSALEIVMPLENKYTAIVDGSIYMLNPGDILLIPSMKVHSYMAPQRGTRMFYLFDLDAFSKVKTFGFLKPLLMSPILITKEKASEIYDDAHRLLLMVGNAYFEFGDLRELMVYSLLMKFFALFGNYHLAQIQDSMSLTEKKKMMHYAKFEYIIEYINENFCRPLSLESMAELSHLSKYHFARLFKRYTDLTFYEYLTRRRLEEAVSLLSASSLSITTIALQSGFGNITSFNRVFKKYKNCSPKAFQKHREKAPPAA
jgi:AraC-like DNA-binding protein